VVQKTVGRWGRVDILVSNAGGPPPGVFDDMDDGKWQSAFELNLLSTIRLVREVLPHMRRAGGGVIINIQSISVKVPVDNLILSNSIRSGVIGLAKSLSVELARDRIRVNTLPGLIMTDRQRQMLTVWGQKSGRATRRRSGCARPRSTRLDRGTGRRGQYDCVLASDRARYVTGSRSRWTEGWFEASCRAGQTLRRSAVGLSPVAEPSP
jgi:3-oxoacyl-[acyl-carrier protein] reductase